MRVCVWEDGFEASLRAIEPNQRLADEIVSGVDWVLSRDPTFGVKLPNSEIWSIVSRDIPTQRHFVFFYAFTAEQVFLLSVIQSPMVRG
jgi:hypothetical protein